MAISRNPVSVSSTESLFSHSHLSSPLLYPLSIALSCNTHKERGVTRWRTREKDRERNVSKEILLMEMERLVYLFYIICVMHSIPMILNSSKTHSTTIVVDEKIVSVTCLIFHTNKQQNEKWKRVNLSVEWHTTSLSTCICEKQENTKWYRLNRSQIALASILTLYWCTELYVFFHTWNSNSFINHYTQTSTAFLESGKYS